ncbi:MAG TPA: hypothetical protein P5531_03060 [Bacteroidales bacterium]|nr:hypothetical protein [Bacteroidales bacterium]HSA42502.1 hypothetical protein [Bacteroidales bacterium]
MTQTRILGLLIRDRIKESGRTQQVLSRHQHLIRSRLGFHELSDEKCSRSGIILLQLSGNPDDWKSLMADLEKIGGIEVQQMDFIH